MISVTKKISLVMLIAVIGGCAVGPDYKRPDSPASAVDSFENMPGIDPNDVFTGGRWWESFGDDDINRLVEEGIGNNYDLQAAAARVMQAESLLKSAAGGRDIQVNYSIDRARAKANAGFAQGVDTAWSQGISVSYSADLFGKLRRTEEKAWRDVLAAKENRLALMHSIVASIVKARIQIDTLARQVDVLESNTKSWEQTLAVIERRYERGLLEPLDVRIARENLASSRANEVVARRSLKNSQYALDVLLGGRPGSSSDITEQLERLPDIESAPKSIPVCLVDNRPDIRALEMRLASATAGIGVSMAKLYPDLTLSGSYGFDSGHFGSLLDDQFEAYSLVGRILAPIYQGGSLRAGVDFSEAAAQEAAANYAGAVISALSEVEKALYAEMSVREQFDRLQERLTEAIASEKLARDRYFKGLEKLVTVLETERRRRNAEIEYTLVRGEIFSARVDLYLSIGGDWQLEKTPQQVADQK